MRSSNATPNSSEDEFDILRSITTALTTFPEHELPTLIPHIVDLLRGSNILDSAAKEDKNTKKDSNTPSVLLHKYKSRISTLIQSKSSPACQTGIELAVHSFDVSADCISSSGATWVRLMVPILARPTASLELRISLLRALSTVFNQLTAGKPALTREITTPNLPAFIEHSITLCKSDTFAAPCADALKALFESIRAHSTTLRPFTNKLKDLALAILSKSGGVPDDVKTYAQKILISLPLCTPASKKRGSTANVTSASGNVQRTQAGAVADEYATTLKSVVEEAHLVLDRVFRGVVEDGQFRPSPQKGKLSEDLASANSVLGFAPWKGMNHGFVRLANVIGILEEFFKQPTTVEVEVPFGEINNLLYRILAIIPPQPLFAITTGKSKRSKLEVNHGVEKKERDLLFLLLPSLHCLVVDFFTIILLRLGEKFKPFADESIEQVVYLFKVESWDLNVRLSIYKFLHHYLLQFGKTLQSELTEALHPILSTLCDDLIPAAEETPSAFNPDAIKVFPFKQATASTLLKAAPGKQVKHTDKPWERPIPTTPVPKYITHPEVSLLLGTAISHTPENSLQSELRTKLDRTAIITRNKNALFAATIYPAHYAKSSLLPFLVALGEEDNDIVIDCLAHPRIRNWTAESRKLSLEEWERERGEADFKKKERKQREKQERRDRGELFTDDETDSESEDENDAEKMAEFESLHGLSPSGATGYVPSAASAAAVPIATPSASFTQPTIPVKPLPPSVKSTPRALRSVPSVTDLQSSPALPPPARYEDFRSPVKHSPPVSSFMDEDSDSEKMNLDSVDDSLRYSKRMRVEDRRSPSKSPGPMEEEEEDRSGRRLSFSATTTTTTTTTTTKTTKRTSELGDEGDVEMGDLAGERRGKREEMKAFESDDEDDEDDVVMPEIDVGDTSDEEED